jgi:hypothetical protein
MKTKTVQMADDLPSTTSVETAEISFVENLLKTSQNDFNGEIPFTHSEGLIQKIEK